MANIVDWLRNLGLSQYEAVFSHNEIDFSVLQDLTDADLRELGLPMGPRKKLLRAITELKGPSDDLTVAEKTEVGGDAERRQLTVMFCDMVGSTALSTRLDPCGSWPLRQWCWVQRFPADGRLGLASYSAELVW